VRADSESRRLESCVMSDWRFSRSSRIWDSVRVSSSVGLGDMLDVEENWE